MPQNWAVYSAPSAGMTAELIMTTIRLNSDADSGVYVGRMLTMGPSDIEWKI